MDDHSAVLGTGSNSWKRPKHCGHSLLLKMEVSGPQGPAQSPTVGSEPARTPGPSHMRVLTQGLQTFTSQ